MTRHRLTVLAVVAVSALVAALWVGNKRVPDPEIDAVAEPLVPGLKEQLNAISRLRITQGGDSAVATIEKQGETWVLANRDGYPADVTRLRELLIKLADAKLIERKTASPDLHARLGVEDVAKVEAKGLRIDLEGGSSPMAIIIGNVNSRGGESTFVRRANEDQSWLASGSLRVEREAANWLRKTLTDIQSTRIRKVSITDPDGKQLVISKTSETDANFSVADLPKGRELVSEYVGNGLGGTLAGLNFDDVAKAADVPADARVYQQRFETFDGLVIASRSWEIDGKTTARFEASLDEEIANAAITAAQEQARADAEAAQAEAAAKAESDAASATPAEGADAATESAADTAAESVDAPVLPSEAELASARESKLAELRKEVEALNAIFRGWQFVIPSWKAGNLHKRMDDVLKPLAADEAEK